MDQSVSPFTQELIEICSGYLEEKCYAGTIPEKVLNKIRKKFDVPSNEQLLAFFDYTIFGNGKEGFAVGEDGLYWRETWSNTFIPWSRFIQIVDVQADEENITFDKYYNFLIVSCPISHDRLVELMEKLRDSASRWIKQQQVDNRTQSVKSFTQELIEICSRYLGEKCYAGIIPENILNNVRKKFEVPDNEQLLAFFDYTIFGNGKDGFAVGEDGLYWRESWSNHFISWPRLIQMGDIQVDCKNIIFDCNYSFDTEACPISHVQLLELMCKLKDCALKWIQHNQGNSCISDVSNGHMVPAIIYEGLSLEQALKKVFRHFMRGEVYLYPIPESIFEQIRLKFKLTDSESIIAYFDFTILGKGREGVVMTAKGMYWKVFTNTYVSWLSLAAPDEITANDESIYPFFGKELSLAGSPLNQQEWIELFSIVYSLPQMTALRAEMEARLNAEISADPNAVLREAVDLIMDSYQGAKVHTGPLLDVMRNRLCTHFHLPLDLSIWAYFDFSFNGRDGVLFTEIGVYWGNSGDFFTPWYCVPDMVISFDPVNDNLLLDNDTRLSLLRSPIQKEEWIQLLSKIKELKQVKALREQRGKSLRENSHTMQAEHYDELFIKAICIEHSFLDKFVDYAFDEQTEERVRLSYRIEDSELMIAYHRGNTQYKGEVGLVLTSRAIYIANSADSGLPSRVILALDNLVEANLTATGKSLNLEGEEIYRDSNTISFVALIADIALYVESLEAVDLPVEYPYDLAYAKRWNLPVINVDTERWILAEEGMFRGIYYRTELQWAIETGQLKPWETQFWRKGLPGWISAKEGGFISV